MEQSYYVCLNCGYIQTYSGNCKRCEGAVKELSSSEVEMYKKKVLKKSGISDY